ncbi:MAG: glycosyltransferase family 2 protein [Candidatus Adiutrix sp.]|jgi:dTDP-glucose pyrophosphorylase|nr:glycosyltransferase family 2 protein [Candidatus Adiutrix sp.]
MKILVPMAENERRGAETPYGRSLYEIERKTILQHVCEQLMAVGGAEFVFVLNRREAEENRLDQVIRLIAPGARVVLADGPTAGSACSCLLAVDCLREDEPLIVAGGDQMVTVALRPIVEKFVASGWDGGVIYFDDVHPRWSYIRLDEEGFVTEAAEKNPISRNATTGFYYYRRAGDFIEAVFSMIRKKSSVNGRYYVCPAYNELVLRQKRIGTHRIEKSSYFNFSHSKGAEMFGEYLRQGAGSHAGG